MIEITKGEGHPRTIKVRNRRPRNYLVVIGVLLILLVIFASGTLYQQGRLQSSAATRGTLASTTIITSSQISQDVVNGVVSVGPGQYQYYQFIVLPDAYNDQLSGNFTASGGSGNNIVVLVMGSTDFVNWQNHHDVSPYYNSGQVTTNRFSLSLPSNDVYYLVYSNTFSTLSSKTVNTQVNFVYSIANQTVVTYTIINGTS